MVDGSAPARIKNKAILLRELFKVFCKCTLAKTNMTAG